MTSWVLAIYDDMCRAKGKPVCLPQPFHTCTPMCKLIEIPRSKPPHFVCEWSRNIHVCGEKCTMGEMQRGREGFVCPLTRFVLPDRVYEHYTTISKSDSRKRTGDHHIKMASGQKRRRRSSSITESKDKLVITVKKTLLAIMTGPERRGIYETAKKR